MMRAQVRQCDCPGPSALSSASTYWGLEISYYKLLSEVGAFKQKRFSSCCFEDASSVPSLSLASMLKALTCTWKIRFVTNKDPDDRGQIRV